MTKGAKHSTEDRVVDILERFAAAMLYCKTSMDHKSVGRVLAMGNTRTSKILEGLKKDA